jgi:pimeloyl-ACP methyl ester carboxylesterase
MRRGYVDTAAGQVHFRERVGSSEAAPVVFLHQTPSSSAMWQRVLERYPGDRRLVALDTPGFGLSDAPAACPPDGIAFYARTLLEAIDGLGIEGFDLVGFHTGAVIGAEIAAQAGDRVGSLVLLGMVVVTPQEGRAKLDTVGRWQRDARGDYLVGAQIPKMRERVTTDDAEHFTSELIDVMRAGPDWWWGYQAVFTYDAAARLPLVTAPTLVAVGDGDEEAMFGWCQKAAELLPQADYELLPGLGVEMCFEAPDRVVAVVDGFVAVAA